MSAQFSFNPDPRVAEIRRRLGHPVIDGDGHFVEVIPLVEDFVRELAGESMVKRFRESPFFLSQKSNLGDVKASQRQRARTFFTLPERNTLDRMTAQIPGLMRARMEEIGVDFSLLYPSLGLLMLTFPDDEVRQAVCRACNRYYAEMYAEHRDRLEPVAVIPTYSPQEAIAELDYAIGTLGLKAAVFGAFVPRRNPDGSVWLDTLAHDSQFDYDPLWAKCVEHRVAPAFHNIGFGFGTRCSTRNYVYNHLGHFAFSQEAICRSLFMGGVPRRFPALRFSFLEGGVGWACQLYSDIHGHYAKRNRDAVGIYDPRLFDLDLAADLLQRFGRGRLNGHAQAYLDGARRTKAALDDAARDAATSFDDFAEARIDSAADIAAVFARQFFFGCEADDPMNSVAFSGSLLPHGIKLNAVYASDIGHWDVPDMRDVLVEAYEPVDHGHMSAADFRQFACGNVVRFLTDANPDFFAGTAVADAVRPFIAAGRA
ncbi:MAG: amidohydrolase family protein [Gammaproteobacteria bacterium]